MRNRYDSNGKIIGAHRMIFDDTPDDYQLKPLIGENHPDLSYAGTMKFLRRIKAGVEFENYDYYSKEVLSSLALDYLQSALYLQKGVHEVRGELIVSYHLLPCAFLCRHSIELKLKECLLTKYGKFEKSHDIEELWEMLNENDIINYDKLAFFIKEVGTIDRNAIALRYGITQELQPMKEDFVFNIDILLENTKYFFNVVDEYIISKYRYKQDIG